MGRLALVDHADKALNAVEQKLRQLGASQPHDENQQEPVEIRIVLLTGMGGGTGGGMAIDLANVARSRAQVLGYRVRIQGVMVCTCLENVTNSPLSAANSYALLAELQYVSMFGNKGSSADAGSLKQLELPDRPFDEVYCVKLLQRVNEPGYDGLGLIAKQLSLTSLAGVWQNLQCSREVAPTNNADVQEPLRLHTFGGASLGGPRRKHMDRLAKRLAQVIESQWLDICPNKWEQLDRAIQEEELRSKQAEDLDAAEELNTLAAVSRIEIEKWRHAFGAYSSSRFAFEVLSRIYNRAVHCDDNQMEALSSQKPERFVEIAVKALGSVSENATGPRRKRIRSRAMTKVLFNGLRQRARMCLQR